MSYKYKTTVRAPVLKAPDWCKVWYRKYKEKTGRRYVAQWGRDTLIMRTLMGYTKTDRELMDIIDFAFSNHPSTNYLYSTGYKIAVFKHQFNQYQINLQTPGAQIPEWELALDVPVWNDERTAWLYKRIRECDIDQIIKRIHKRDKWDVLRAKLHRQKGFVPELVEIYYDLWRMKERITRKGVR